jgi:hypothetical protein
MFHAYASAAFLLEEASYYWSKGHFAFFWGLKREHLFILKFHNVFDEIENNVIRNY